MLLLACCQLLRQFLQKGEELGGRGLPGEEADDAHEDEVERNPQPPAMEVEELSEACPWLRVFFPSGFSPLWFLW